MKEVEVFLKVMGEITNSNSIIISKIIEKLEQIEKSGESLRKELNDIKKNVINSQVSPSQSELVKRVDDISKKNIELQRKLEKSFEEIKKIKSVSENSYWKEFSDFKEELRLIHQKIEEIDKKYESKNVEKNIESLREKLNTVSKTVLDMTLKFKEIENRLDVHEGVRETSTRDIQKIIQRITDAEHEIMDLHGKFKRKSKMNLSDVEKDIIEIKEELGEISDRLIKLEKIIKLEEEESGNLKHEILEIRDELKEIDKKVVLEHNPNIEFSNKEIELIGEK